MTQTTNENHYETLQVTPTAEPEVVVAAYRALAKKYHPDRSEAPDAMARMARINVAFHALRARIGRTSLADIGLHESSHDFTVALPRERIDPTSSLEDILAIVTRKIAAAREYLIGEITRDGLARDLATNLVNTALKAQSTGESERRSDQARPTTLHIDQGASYDDALRVVTQEAKVLRDQLAEHLVQSGLNRGVAVEISDQAFERIRRKTGKSTRADTRLTPEHVDLSASLDNGVRVVGEKLMTARQLVIDELTRDGVPPKTAERLLDTAFQHVAKNPHR